jgi:hypothetical protein
MPDLFTSSSILEGYPGGRHFSHAQIIIVVGREGSGYTEEVFVALILRFDLEINALDLRHVAPNTFIALLPNMELADRVFNGGQPLFVPPL